MKTDSTNNKIKYWTKALAMDAEALHYAVTTPRSKVRKHVECYLPLFKDSIHQLEGLLQLKYDTTKRRK